MKLVVGGVWDGILPRPPANGAAETNLIKTELSVDIGDNVSDNILVLI
jgi:hypothetical protein